MYIRNESRKEAESRLLKVLKSTRFKVFDENYYFKESPVDSFEFNDKALAMVKDSDVWNYLIHLDTEIPQELFKIFSFHFEDGFDNSGFVGWLAWKIKEEFGSGVFVLCGQNSSNGGIFDYWGCPFVIAGKVIDYINDLRIK